MLQALRPSAVSCPHAEQCFFCCECLTLKVRYYASPTAVWDASYVASDHSDLITIEGRLALSSGLGYILAALPEDQRMDSFEGLAGKSLDRLEKSAREARHTQHSSRLTTALLRLADEIRILSTMSRSFADAGSPDSDTMESGCDTSPERHAPIPEPVMLIIDKGWPSITHAAAHWADDEVRIRTTRRFHCFVSAHRSTHTRSSCTHKECCCFVDFVAF
jgi:hypothetical protein